MNIPRSDELPFRINEDVARSIDGYVDALERNDPNIDLYECDVWQASRCVPENQELWIQEYYVKREYLNDPQGKSLKANANLIDEL